jgi:pyruvate kinase
MLNKGPFIVEAVAFLSDVLTRMRTHHDKKRALLRALSVSRPLATETARPTEPA